MGKRDKRLAKQKEQKAKRQARDAKLERIRAGINVAGDNDQPTISVQEMAEEFARMVIKKTWEEIERVQIEKCENLKEQGNQVLVDKNDIVAAINLYE